MMGTGRRYTRLDECFDPGSVRWHERLSSNVVAWCPKSMMEGSLVAQLWDTKIVEYNSGTGILRLNHGGWTSATTRNWINNVIWIYFRSMVRLHGLRVFIKHGWMQYTLNGEEKPVNYGDRIGVPDGMDAACRTAGGRG